MARKKKREALERPDAPVDIFTLEPEPDLIASGAPTKTTESQAGEHQRVNTSISMLASTHTKIKLIQSQYRLAKGRSYPMWRLLKDAVDLLAQEWLSE